MPAKIVMIGGGSGLPVIIKPLVKQEVDLTAIVTVADDGGSSGLLRDYVNIIPPGDIRNIMVAMSTADQELLALFQYRFQTKDDFLAKHAVGNLLIAALTEMTGDVSEAITRLAKYLKIKGQVYPVAKEPLILQAETTDGQKLSGEAAITAAHQALDHVWVSPSTKGQKITANPEAVDAILSADMIVYGPGSLFTSILPNIVVPGIKEALQATPAKQVYIANIMTQKGETDAYTDAEHLAVLNRHLGKKMIDAVLTNQSQVPADFVDYQRWGEISTQVKQDPKAIEKEGAEVVSRDFLLLRDAGAFHDGQKVADLIFSLLEG
ncbi:YvcK family protein [Fructobacillus sp. M1-13]|uniref:Putative gluconeogenesis factor n=1 Tax=Fructobacillus papyriferae TaxID=2713171 RepID=A0ABS5QSU3_9LACO|nr:gluconeogenesis factor YvcK family protein [Fructobacillus papyriferae]MBS9335384.1 YvcK family protein [Fructobacillus papyriferae]MCD2158946.1 YvcK family protein [Fructobacillus papyriferae]